MPLTLKLVGAVSLNCQAPMKPNDWLAPRGMAASQLRFRTETSAPVWVNAAFHAPLMASSPGNLKVSVQPWMLVLPLLVMVISALNALGQLVEV
jgi:hypothetical protein